MGKIDKAYTHRGANAEDGNYPVDYTAGSRVFRLLSCKRGRWIGGRGRVIGLDLNNMIKMDETTVAEIPGLVDIALKPLTDLGEISDVEVRADAIQEMEGAIGNIVDFTDRTSTDGSPHTGRAGWKG